MNPRYIQKDHPRHTQAASSGNTSIFPGSKIHTTRILNSKKKTADKRY